MKNTILFFFLFLFLNCADAQKNNFSKDALTATLLAEDGTQLPFETVLKKHRGRKIVLAIWASWCGDCVKAMPKMKALQSNHPEVDYVFVSLDKTEKAWKKGIEKHNLQGDMYLASGQMTGIFAKAVDVNWIPRYMVLDAAGTLVLYKAIETDFDKIERALQ